jgi:bacterial/archaeal transporter family protein
MERLGWLALVMVTWGSANFLLKIVGERLDSYSAALAIVVGYVVVGTTFSLAGGGRLGVTWPHGVAAIIGALYIIGNWAFLHLARTEDISSLSPMAGLAIVLPIVLGFALLGEAITLKKLTGIVFALVAIVLLS